MYAHGIMDGPNHPHNVHNKHPFTHVPANTDGSNYCRTPSNKHGPHIRDQQQGRVSEVSSSNHRIPPVSTLLRVLTKHPDELSTFPGFNRSLLTKHRPPSTATAKGHMTRTRKGLRSTRNVIQEMEDARAKVDEMAPTEQICTAIDNENFCYAVTTSNDGNVVYSDLPGRFPIESYAVMNYLFVAYVYKCNYIII